MLTKFVERPAIREAFKANAAKVKLPFDARGLEPAAPSSGLYHSSVGTAFDYLARFRLARDVMQGLPHANVAVYDTGWAAEESVVAMRRHPKYRQHHERWSFLVAKARELFNDYAAGREPDIGRVATCCQFLAAVDLLVRIGDFNPAFRPRDEVQAELLKLDAAFQPLELFAPQSVVHLNPVFMASDLVDGADADLIVDDTLIDVKTTNDIGVSSSHLRQLVGYKVLHDLGGVDVGGGETWSGPIGRVGVYFSRYGRLATWRVDEILPGQGFERFVEIFIQEAEAEKARMASPGQYR